MVAIVLDIVVVAALVLFAWRGAKKGLIFTLFGLLALIVALVGANLLADELAPKAAAALEPRISAAVEEQLGDTLAQSMPNLEQSLGEENPLTGILGAIQSTELYQQIAAAMQEAVDSGVEAAAATLGGVIAGAVAQAVARTVIFVVGFLVILIVWLLSAHVLDFVCQLPILHGLNTAGGLLMGLFKGVVILLLAAWFFCTFLGLVDADIIDSSYVLKYFARPNLLTGLLGL